MTTAQRTSSPNPQPEVSLWSLLSDELDITPALYQRAADRHVSVGDWLCRSGSSVEDFRPRVRPQGSFRYGTVVKPIIEGTAYDLDQVVVFESLSAGQVSQAELKALLGTELQAYADAHRMLPAESKHRCWRLNYRDEAEFHLDSLPSVPAGIATFRELRLARVDEPLALRAIAITDDRHPGYQRRSSDWYTSNPRGFARWFEAKAARGRDAVENMRRQAGVEDVPPYEWRTPLQRSIQILKRHRDVMYRDQPALAPISMIITNLAAHAYDGETDTGDALRNIVEHMGDFVQPNWPKVPNPTHPREDYADKWRRQPVLEMNFWRWLEQARATVRLLGRSVENRHVESAFAMSLTEEHQLRLGARTSPIGPATFIMSRPHDAPRPWASRPAAR